MKVGVLEVRYCIRLICLGFCMGTTTINIKCVSADCPYILSFVSS